MKRFDQYLPSDILKPYIRYFAIAENDAEDVYKVLPGTSLVMGFQFKGQLSQLSHEVETSLSLQGITGLQDSYRVFRSHPGTGSVLVYFNETGASFFFKTSLHELFSQSLPLDHFIGKSLLSTFEERLSGAQTDTERIVLTEAFLISQLQAVQQDLLVITAIHHMYHSGGTIRMKDLASKLHTSQSPLEKRFRKAVGATPKKFASIVRLQSTINRLPDARSMTDLGYASGYYDQAHFIKDFSRFTGETPEQFFKKK